MPQTETKRAINRGVAIDLNYYKIDDILDNVNTKLRKGEDVLHDVDKLSVFCRSLKDLDTPTNHISSIIIDQSYTVDPLHVLVTGDIAVKKNQDGNIIYDGHSPLIKSYKDNVISWIRKNTDLLCRRYDYALDVMNIKIAEESDFNKDNNFCMRLPKFWWKSTMIDNDHCKVDFCHEEKYVDNSWHCWEGNTLIDCKKITAFSPGTLNDMSNKFEYSWMQAGTNRTGTISLDGYSVSSIRAVPIINVTQKEFKNAARNTCPNLSLVTYESHQIMALLFYAFYGEVDAQKICGNNGGTSDFGFDQIIKVGDVKDTRKLDNHLNNIFWFLHDWWGNCNEFVDNLVTLSKHASVSNSYSKNFPYSEIGILDYEGKVKRIIKVPTYNIANTKMILGENFDLLPRIDSLPNNKLDGGKDYDGDSFDLGWADYAHALGEPGCVAFRGGNGSNSSGGVACLYVYYGPDDFSQYFGSRLQYAGPMVEVDSF